ncbi:MAG: glycosyltransferase family protein [Rhodospirillales bacterium]
MTSAGRILFYVQHLLGMGHLRRSVAIVRAAARAGLDATLVTGGRVPDSLDVAGLDVVALPPLRAADENFKRLVDDDGRDIDDAYKEARRRLLHDTLARVRPQALVTELFPFGRRQLAFELVPFVEAARAMQPRPLIVSSVRDVVEPPSKPERLQEMMALAERLFDVALVHGDPQLVRLEDSFPTLGWLPAQLIYTGYVVEDPLVSPAAAGDGTGEVIVSAGGGRVGATLLHAAMDARPRTVLRDAPWRLLAGPLLPDESFAALRAAAPPGVAVERARRDFIALLHRARLSISQGGYNTVCETLAAGVPAVVVPFSGGRETEQRRRAELLAARGAFEVVAADALTPAALAAAADRAVAAPRRMAAVDLDGAAATARILAGLLAGRAAA